MEPMDLDNSDNLCYRSNRLPSPTASPPHSPTNIRDLSDMEIDSNSPPSQQPHCLSGSERCVGNSSSSGKTVDGPSSLLHYVNASLGGILSLKTEDSLITKHGVNVKNRFPVCGVNQSVTPARMCHSAPMISSTRQRTNEIATDTESHGNGEYRPPPRPRTSLALSTPVKSTQKNGYGLNDEDLFCHYPRSTPEAGSLASPMNNVRNRSIGHARMTNKVVESNSNPAMSAKGNSHSDSNSKQTKVGHVCDESIVRNVFLKLFYIFTCVSVIVIVCGMMLLYNATTSESCRGHDLFENRSLEVDLKSDLFGQHIASEMIKKHLHKYFSQYNLPTTENGNTHLVSDKQQQTPTTAQTTGRSQQCPPLILSFHGWTGVGKNFASGIIAGSFNAVNVHQLIIPLLFPHAGSQELYGDQIRDWILSNITRCSVNVFLIDEMDKAFPAVVRGLLSAVRSVSSVCSTAPTPVLFILISNTHAVEINKVFVDHFTNDHPSPQNRLDIKEEYFHSIFKSGHDEDKDWYSDLLSAGVVDAFVPFLPLEKTHVIDCIKRDLVSKQLSTDGHIVSKVIDELSFSVLGDLQLSNTGCKRVADKVNYVVFNKMD